MNRTAKLIASIVICEGAGLIGSVFTAPAMGTWYENLQKPALNPSNWIFAPVWIVLFLLMGVSLYLVWNKIGTGTNYKKALTVFGLQLVLNILWSVVFFGLHSPFWALVDLALLWLAILFTIVKFHPISRPAALILLPYILWVGFAGYLNYSIWNLNRAGAVLPVVCTMEAKLCPDGSYVGRTGPRCEFAPCPRNTNSGISGLVLLGPTCSVERIPPEPQCADKPYQTNLELLSAGNRQLVDQFDSGSDGKFMVKISPGDYIIQSPPSANLLPRCSSSGTIKVAAGSFTGTIVYCDTGIR